MRIMGVDSSTVCTGYSILDDETLVCCNRVKTFDSNNKILDIYNKLKAMIEEYKPDQIAMEEGFVGGKNKGNVLLLAEVRGAVKLLAQQYNLPITTYFPSTIKKAVAGKGDAEKMEVYISLKNRYEGDSVFEGIGAYSEKEYKKKPVIKTDDMFDSIAIGLTHLYKLRAIA